MCGMDDLIFIDPYHDEWLSMYIRRIKLLDIIQEITDPAELPEYLTDEDVRVVEMATTRLEQLMESKNGS